MDRAVELEALAERVEALTGPCEETDALIRCKLYAPEGGYVEQSRINGAWCVYDGTRDFQGRPRLFQHWPSRDAKCAAFTASLDAAMSLVPEGWFTSDFHQGPSGGNWWELSHIKINYVVYITASGQAPTPALALTSAALRALAAVERGK